LPSSPSTPLVRTPACTFFNTSLKSQLISTFICISCCMWPCRIEASPTISSKQNNLHTYTRKETIYPCKDDIMQT
jgi:hypothetical protein